MKCKVAMPRVSRKSGDGTLTGGLGDVNPSFLSTTITQSANDTTTSQTIQTPITVVAGRGTSDVMEILKVFFYIPGILPAGGTSAQSISVYLSTKNFTTTAPTLSFGDALVFAGAETNYYNTAVSGVGEEASQTIMPVVQDLTDSAGHGFLVATSNIYAQLASASTTSTNATRIKILYRLKKVTESQLTSLLLSQNQG